MLQTPTRYGLLNTFSPDLDLISKFLTKYGEWGQHEIEFIADNLRGDASICDIGAFLGTFSLGVAQLKQVTKVCLVDANPAVIPLLTANVERNLPAKFQIVEAIAGGQGQQGGFVVPNNIGTFSVVASDADERNASPSAGQSVSLSELIHANGPFDLIKIDAEGMENEIISEDLDLLQSVQSDFWFECNPTVASLNLLDRLVTAKFSVFYFAFPAINLNNFSGEETVEFPFAHEAGLFATRAVRPNLSPKLASAGCVLTQVKDRESLRDVLWLTPRWAPAGWEKANLPEVVALATHALLGESKDVFLRTADADSTQRRWANPFQEQVELIDSLKSQFAVANSKIRAYEIMLAKERERARDCIVRLECHVTQLTEQHQSELQSFATAAETKAKEHLDEADRYRTLANERFNELNKYRVQASDYLDQIHELSDRVHMYAGQARHANEQIVAIHRSRSWKAMRPARMLGRLARGEWRYLFAKFLAK